MQKRKIAITILILAIVLLLTPKAQATEKDITQTFVDQNLQNSILELAKNATGDENKTKIYESDIDKIVEKVGGTSLKLQNKGIKSLAGIEAFANKEVTWIFLDWNEITDLNPLKTFKNLTKISFSGNQVSDLTPLASVTTLENIIAINNKISSIDTIKNLTNIKYICLDGNNLTNINAITDWSNLIELSFQNNKITEIPNLEKLTQLNSINISNNQIQTINNMAKLESIENLEINNNLLASLEGVQNLINLKILSCSNNQLKQISGLERLSNLENVDFNKNQIQDINKLKQNMKIKYLYLDSNVILDFSTLEQLPNLQKYSIYNQSIFIEVKEKLVGDYILVPLPDLYSALYNTNSFIHQNNLTTEAIGTNYYEVDKSKKNIKLKANDLKRNNITIRVFDNNNTFLTYTIQADKIAPVIEGVINNKTYIEESVIPICDDDDIGDVQLTKNGLKVVYNLGDTIKDNGKYILRISDKAGNQATAQFEIRDEIIESDTYKIDGQYITGITSNTDFNNFKKLLKTEGNYNIYRENQKLSANQIIVTGDKLTTQYGKNFYLVVKGDITKDGYANISDLVRLRKYILKIDQFSELEKKAADLSGDKKADIQDLVYIRQTIINK